MLPFFVVLNYGLDVTYHSKINISHGKKISLEFISEHEDIFGGH